MLPLTTYIKFPRLFGLAVLTKLAKYFTNDKLYLQLRYYFELGKKLNLDNPRTFNEKLNWLKLYNRKPEYTMMVDKYAVKDYVAKRIGSEFVIPTLGIWSTIEEIDFDKLPNQFVLKTTHGGGSCGVVICKDKATFDKKRAIEKLNKSLSSDIYIGYREWPYKDVSRKVIAEVFLEDEKHEDLVDYKFFCFNGEPKLCQVISDRRTEEKIDFYNMDWRRVEGLVGLNPSVCNSTDSTSCPCSFDQMKKIATTLSKGIPFVRVDLYEINGRCYFGEITFFPAGAMGIFRPNEWNEIIGNYIHLPLKD